MTVKVCMDLQFWFPSRAQLKVPYTSLVVTMGSIKGLAAGCS